MKHQKMMALVLTMAMLFGLSSCGGNERLIWPETSLGERLPNPPVKNGEIVVETSSTLHARAVDATERHYQNFVKDCEDSGFTVDIKREDNSFSAYDEDGYFVEVWYTQSEETINITIKASIEDDFSEIEWPKSEIAGSIPVPKSNIGIISWENEDGFVIYIGETSKEDYDEYVSQCYEAGFTIDYNKGDDYFRGINRVGYHLNVDYEWNQTMFIRMDTAEALGQEPPEQTSEESFAPTDTPVVSAEPVETLPTTPIEQPDTSPPPSESTAVIYSTNDYETAKNGNSGVFSYVNRGSNYYTYWIIDFDEGYVYNFTDGNGSETCDRTAIESGDLNDVLITTYHDGNDTWSYGLHFHYKNHPSTLIVQDNDGFEWGCSTTDLSNALDIRDSKIIQDY